MHLVASVCPSVRLCALSQLNRLTYEKGNRSHYQFKVFVRVSLISGRMRIIARMRSIGVLISSGKGSVILARLTITYCLPVRLCVVRHLLLTRI